VGTTRALLWFPRGSVYSLSVAPRVALGVWGWPGKRESPTRRSLLPLNAGTAEPFRVSPPEAVAYPLELTFNTLKNQGYHFEHNYGHGEQNLSVVFAMLMMLAFLVDQTQQLCCALFRAVWAKLGSKRLLWERMRALFYDYRLHSMRELLEALYVGFAKSHPMILTDSS
jgi:hypothetical protein